MVVDAKDGWENVSKRKTRSKKWRGEVVTFIDERHIEREGPPIVDSKKSGALRG